VQGFGLHAGHKRALQRLGHERILFRLEVALGSLGAFAILVDRRQIKKGVAVAVDKVLEEPGYFGLGGRVFDIVDESRESQNLPLAEQLLRLIELEELNFLCQGPRQIGLLNALVVAQLVLAKLQHLTVVKADGQGADKQQRAQDEPQNAHTSFSQALPQG
jgi:hypothetical protein